MNASMSNHGVSDLIRHAHVCAPTATVTPMATVLLVEDDHVVRGALQRSLTDLGHAVQATGTALEALRRVAADPPDVIVLDLGLPDLDGADDYMVKPFSSAHLDARVASVLRRTGRASRAEPVVLESAGLRIDLGERQAYLDGAALALTRKEFDLLAYLAGRPGQVVSRRELLEEVWRQPSIGEDQTIDVHLYWLRRKLGESAAEPRFLHTVRGVGIKFAAPA